MKQTQTFKKITKEYLKIDEMDFKNYRERPSSAEPWLYRPTNSPGKCWYMYSFIHSVSVQCLLCADTILNTGDSETDFHRPPPTPTTHRHKYMYTHTPVPIEFIFKSGETDNEWNITFSSSNVCCGEKWNREEAMAVMVNCGLTIHREENLCGVRDRLVVQRISNTLITRKEAIKLELLPPESYW